MSLTEGAYPNAEDALKKRRLANESPTSGSNVCSPSNSTVKSPIRKRCKRNSFEQGFSNKTRERIKADSMYEIVSQKTCVSPTEDNKTRTPCYKKTVFPESPTKADPYELPDTPQRPRKLVRAKARTNLLESCAVADIATNSTPEPQKDKCRKPPSSPHPGKDAVLGKKKVDEDAVPSVSFNSLAPNNTSLTPSYTSFASANITECRHESLINLRTPTSRSYLKRGTPATSSKTRLPVVVDWSDQRKSDIPSFSASKPRTSLINSRSTASISLMALIDTGKTLNLRRQRSSSFESLTNTFQEFPSRNLRLTPERLKTLSLESKDNSMALRKNKSVSTLPDTGNQTERQAIQNSPTVKHRRNSEQLPSYKTSGVVDPNQNTSRPVQRTPQKGQASIPQENNVTIPTDYSLQTPEVVMDSQEVVPLPISILRSPDTPKLGKHITFGSLDVYYFGRDQGFEVVPKHGEVALGMRYSHFQARQFKILKTKRQRINFDDNEESELSEDEEIGIVESQFYEKPQNERIKMLEAAGVVIEKQKKNNLIRQGREQCGCSCRGGVCKPAICECFRLGIKCQVDGPKENGSTYPCTCYNGELCSNEYGRDAYDFDRITKSRRAAIQRWRDREKTGIHAPCRLIKFKDEEEVVADSQEAPIPTCVTEQYPDSASCSPSTTEDTNVLSGSSNFFPPSQSLL